MNMPVILGSRSPRRLELLSHLVPRDRIRVCQPRSEAEAGFDDLDSRELFDDRILEIAETKLNDVLDQVVAEAAQTGGSSDALVLAADTTVVATGADGRSVSLGQPPEDDVEATVRRWFREFFAGKTHEVLSGVCLARVSLTESGLDRQNLIVLRRVCSTKVKMRHDADSLLDWYLSTGESRGKAGGYAIQGAASVFVTQITGSLSNVIGLPLEVTRDLLAELETRNDGTEATG